MSDISSSTFATSQQVDLPMLE